MFVQLKFLDCVTFGKAEDLTAQFTLDCSVCCVLKAEAHFVYIFNFSNITQHGHLVPTSLSMATCSKDFLLEFIELFRQEECLWKLKSKDYYNRSKKDASYGTLIGKVQEVEPDATRDTVVKKINNLRSAFRKEHKKVIKSQVSGAGAEEMYAPRI